MSNVCACVLRQVHKFAGPARKRQDRQTICARSCVRTRRATPARARRRSAHRGAGTALRRRRSAAASG
jgi:hypothetical protein